MGWSSGSELVEEIWDLFKDLIPDKQEEDYANLLAELFKDADCDTLDECDFYQRYVTDYSCLAEED